MANHQESVSGNESLAHPSRPRDLQLDQVKLAVEGIRYGEVRVIIQDGVIIQIERVEKRRLR